MRERDYIGHISQLFSVKQYRFDGGWADGVRAVDISNGAGLSFTVLVDRAMDIFHITYKGKNLCYQTPVGIKAPQYFDALGEGWMHSFGGGFFVTCGLENIGSCCAEDGENYPVHGRVSSIPADSFAVCFDDEADTPSVTLSGTMNQSVMFGTQLTLKRKITCKYGENRITVEDTVTNGGARQSAHMMLYHFNLGYPLFDENARVHIPSSRRIPRNSLAAGEMDLWDKFTPPIFGYGERCYYHEGMRSDDGRVTFGMSNKKSDLAVSISYNIDSLPRFMQWKMTGTNEYVCGLEPCNATIDGRDKARADGSLRLLKPGERVNYSLIIDVGAYERRD